MLSLYLIPPGSALSRGSTIVVSGDEAHHISRVARHRVGEEILISDGSGIRAKSRIIRSDRENVEVEVIEVTRSSDPTIRFRVIQALPKSDRAHECIELLVAAGVDEITPWSAERSIAKWDERTSVERWNGWIRAAVKQTRRDRIPSLTPLMTQLEVAPSQRELVIAFDENAEVSLGHRFFEAINSSLSGLEWITILIGPEGGISPEELARLSDSRVAIVRLGNPILRSAHAGAIALAAIQASLSIWR